MGFDYASFPTFLFPVGSNEAKRIIAADLRVYVCADCGHLFQSDVDLDLLAKIYGDYYRHYTGDTGETMLAPYRDPFDAVAKLVLRTRPWRSSPRLVEIGCSRVESLVPFADMGFDCTGVDPSPLAATPHEKIRLIAGYYETSDIGGAVDVVISRFNLEHIVDLEAFMRKLVADLRDDGVLLVQIPNVEHYFRNRQPLFVAHEHIHYFSPRSLDSLLGRFGLRPLVFYASGQPSIIACYSRDADPVSIQAPNLHPAVEPFKATAASRQARVLSLVERSKRIVLYGCGMSMFWMLPTLLDGTERSIRIVDDNPRVHGKLLPVFGLPVEPATPEVFAECDTVLLTLSPIYHARVRQRLAEMRQPMRVISIATEGVEEYQLP